MAEPTIDFYFNNWLLNPGLRILSSRINFIDPITITLHTHLELYDNIPQMKERSHCVLKN